MKQQMIKIAKYFSQQEEDALRSLISKLPKHTLTPHYSMRVGTRNLSFSLETLKQNGKIEEFRVVVIDDRNVSLRMMLSLGTDMVVFSIKDGAVITAMKMNFNHAYRDKQPTTYVTYTPKMNVLEMLDKHLPGWKSSDY